MNQHTKHSTSNSHSTKPRDPRDRELAPGLWCNDLIGRDVSILDRRSVKYQLQQERCGRTPWRVRWWNLFTHLYRRLHPARTHEQAMVAFHNFHHRITLRWLWLRQEHRHMVRTIHSDGLLAACRSSWARLRDGC